VPAGSWEDDDELIAIACDLTLPQFTLYRAHLMRGWQRHSDGRLYHPHVTEMVGHMIDGRRSNAERQRRYREANEARKKAAEEAAAEARESQGVTRDKGDVTRYSAVSNGLEGNRKITRDIEKTSPCGEVQKKPPKPPEPPPDPPAGMDAQAWEDYVEHRRAIKAPPLKPKSVTALQAWLADQGPPAVQREIVHTSVRNGWRGLFELKTPKGRPGPGNNRAQQIDEAVDNWLNPSADRQDREPIQGEFRHEPK
jgi:hypothetical protein